jgi:hypothetical protein
VDCGIFTRSIPPSLSCYLDKTDGRAEIMMQFENRNVEIQDRIVGVENQYVAISVTWTLMPPVHWDATRE